MSVYLVMLWPIFTNVSLAVLWVYVGVLHTRIAKIERNPNA